jgi:hypothetical protein
MTQAALVEGYIYTRKEGKECASLEQGIESIVWDIAMRINEIKLDSLLTCNMRHLTFYINDGG